jgi:hypothetical protein
MTHAYDFGGQATSTAVVRWYVPGGGTGQPAVAKIVKAAAMERLIASWA